MEFVTEPSTEVKIRKMKERVCWQKAAIAARKIDQTRFVLQDGQPDSPEFSFLVMGDSGSSVHRSYDPQRELAEQMVQHQDECRFALHTGDVIYLVGSSEYYPQNFIQPYREFLVGGENPGAIAYDKMVFKLPILPVPGNHDYYDLPPFYGFLAQAAAFTVRQLLQSNFDFDIGWHGSNQGNAYAKAFLDYLKDLNNADLEQHLDRYYTAQTDTGRCLQYEPGNFTRLPNRYYTFRAGGIDFFALDSNTFNAPAPLPNTREGEAYRRILEQQREELDRQQQEFTMELTKLNSNDPNQVEQTDDLKAKLEQLQELKIDIDKQLASKETTVIDWEQLDWLHDGLIRSWQDSNARGRVLFFHHPPYVTESTKWHQAQTLAVRRRLRRVLNSVAEAVRDRPHNQPIVDLVLNGHAHCLEYLRTVDTGHADARTNWIVCGGSGYSLRRQREEGIALSEFMETGDSNGEPLREQLVARSLLYVGRKGHGSQKRRPYSFIRVDVKEGNPPKFVIRPFISERFQQQWIHSSLEAFTL